jgi:hypothetical protein
VTAPVVQVVTSGVDWPAIVAAISGGMVGLTGISASIWTVRRGIRAEDSRADRAEKRRVYAHFLTCASGMIAPAVDYRAAYQPGTSPEKRASADARLDEMRDALFNANAELRLLAPPAVSDIARDVVRYFMDYIQATHRGASLDDGAREKLPAIQDRTYRAMRVDLGVPDDSVTQPASPGHPDKPPHSGG